MLVTECLTYSFICQGEKGEPGLILGPDGIISLKEGTQVCVGSQTS